MRPPVRSTPTSVVYVTVQGLPSKVKVTLSATAVTTADTLLVTATVTGTAGTPTGTVELCGMQGGTCANGYVMVYQLSNGTYVFSVPLGLLNVGTDTLTVGYLGDAIYAAASGTATVTVTTPPAVSLSATSLSFGSEAVGSSTASQSVTLTNTGGATLTITSIAVTGANASSFVFVNSCGTSLAAGANAASMGTLRL